MRCWNMATVMALKPGTRPLQQILFDTADGVTPPPASSPPAAAAGAATRRRTDQRRNPRPRGQPELAHPGRIPPQSTAAPSRPIPLPYLR